MSSAGTFQGLQFRIMETLEKQPNQAPLTALEIADILHSTEYRNEMKDNVVFKVSRAVHSMKEQGKITVADARDKEGRLCYQLPSRMRFPPKVSDKPANPVLTPEVAAKVRTVQPTAAEKRGRQRPLYVAGIQDKIVEFIDKSPHPVTTADLAATLGNLYGAQVPQGRLTTLFSGNLHHLVKNVRRIFRRRVTGYGTGVQFEYFTRKTGTEPHPLAQKKQSMSVEKVIVETRAPVAAAPLPSQAWAEPAPVASTGGFRPVKREQVTAVVSARVPQDKYELIEQMADNYGVSVSELVVQALDYALEHRD